MSVSVRYTSALTLAFLGMATAAQAGGCNPCGGGGGGNHTTNIPVVSGPTGGCCGSAHGHVIGVPNVYVPGPNVNVNVGGSYFGGTNVSIGGNTFVGGSTTIVGGSSGGGAVYFGGGGGSFISPAPVTAGIIDGLQIGGEEARMVTEQFQDTRTVTETIAIRAVCMDDRLMPHPASRTNGDAEIGSEFNGEVFRCMAGTRMEITVGKVVNGQANFDGGSTLSCQKGQALVYRRKANEPAGTVECVAQKPEADCNERSLLRRFGPGIKFAKVTRTETFTNTRQVMRQQQATFRSSMFVDGGVGQGVF